MLCVSVFIFISGSWALLGCPHYGLLIWLSLPSHIQHTFLRLCQCFSRENGQNTKILKIRHFRMIQNGCRQLLGAQSINTERASLASSRQTLTFHMTCKHLAALMLGIKTVVKLLITGAPHAIMLWIVFTVRFFTFQGRDLRAYWPMKCTTSLKLS